MIPLTATKMSIGIVMDLVAFKAMKKTPERTLEEALRKRLVRALGRVARELGLEVSSDG